MGRSHIAGQLRTIWRPVLLVHLLFTLLGVTVLTPLFGLLLQGLLALSGNAAVADQDIAYLLLTPLGAGAGILLVSVLLAITALELGALQMIALGAQRSIAVTPLAATRYALHHAVPLLRMTLALTLRVLAYLLPFLAVGAAVAWWLLSAHDINYYLASRPPEFQAALAAAAVLLALLFWLLGRRLLGWCLTLPLVLASATSPEHAFRVSEEVTAGQRPLCLRALLGWLVLAALVTLVPALFLGLTTNWMVNTVGQHLPTLVVLLGGAAVVWTGLNILVVALNMAGFTLVTAQLFERLAPTSLKPELAATLRTGSVVSLPGIGGLTALALGAALAAAVGLSLLSDIQLEDEVLVIAHRGAAGSAPENTLASVRQALEDGTDWVEIDVQETRDGEVVVVHDSDFMKLAGDPLKVWAGDLAEIQQIDIGSWFDPAFADQRPPRLLDVLEAVRGRAGLVIELKYYGHDQQLEQRVVDIVEAANMADEVVIMSLKLAGVQKLQALRPQWTVGLLAATSIGDLTRMDVDFLAVNEGMASRAFIKRAHKAGKRVFVWTVNDGLSLSRWASMGVDGVITDEPALARNILGQRAELSSVERLMLGAALFFGKPEVIKQYRDNSP